MGKTNEGISKIIYLNEDLYRIFFNNGATYGNFVPSSFPEDNDLLGSEIASCESLCEKNNKLDNIQIKRNCTQSVPVNMDRLCLNYENSVKCICENKIHKTISRTIKPSESELKIKKKALEDFIWIAPQ